MCTSQKIGFPRPRWRAILELTVQGIAAHFQSPFFNDFDVSASVLFVPRLSNPVTYGYDLQYCSECSTHIDIDNYLVFIVLGAFCKA